MSTSQGKIPIEEIAKFPPPGMSTPVSFSFSPDDRLLTYLYGPDQSPIRQFYSLDTNTGESRVIQASVDPDAVELSLEEQLLRQRQRQLGEGIVRYSWAGKRDVILIPAHSGAYVKDDIHSPARLLVSSGSVSILNPQLSPDGSMVAFVRDAELYVASVDGGETRQITHGARGSGKTHGLAEYIAQEEMQQLTGFWWSKDGSHIAFKEVDETHIPTYRIMHQGSGDTGTSAQEDHRYPFAGQPNAKVRLGVVSTASLETVWMDLGHDEDIYLARVVWMPDGSLCAQIENREQTRLDLVRFDIATGSQATLLSETSEVWINLHDMFRPLDDGSFLWASERTGFMHLYLYDAHGNLVRQLTHGDWVVDSLEGVDQKARFAYFTGTRDGPIERHLYRVSLDSGDIERITSERGTHFATLDHGHRMFIDVFSSVDIPPTVTLRSLEDGSILHKVHEPDDPRLYTLDLTPPDLVTIPTRDGESLHGAVYHPPPDFGSGPYPSVVYVYGGPHAQIVSNHWSMTCAMRVQYLRSQGCLVFYARQPWQRAPGAGFRGQHQAQHGRYRSARPSGRRPLAGRPRSRRSRPRRRIRLELRRVYGPDVPLASARRLHNGRSWSARDPLGRLRHSLHRTLHGHAGVESRRLP